MKKILGLGMVALLVMALVGGGTWAYFSDTETSSSNVFTAGTLDLNLTSTNGTSGVNDSITGTFTTSDWRPGDTSSATIAIKNAGSIPLGHFTLAFNWGTDTNNSNNIVDVTTRPAHITGNGPDVGGGATTDNISKMIKITEAVWHDVKQDGNGGTALLVGQSLDDLHTAGAIPMAIIPANTSYNLLLTFQFDPLAENGCQGNALTMKITANGTQN